MQIYVCIRVYTYIHARKYSSFFSTFTHSLACTNRQHFKYHFCDKNGQNYCACWAGEYFLLLFFVLVMPCYYVLWIWRSPSGGLGQQMQCTLLCVRIEISHSMRFVWVVQVFIIIMNFMQIGVKNSKHLTDTLCRTSTVCCSVSQCVQTLEDVSFSGYYTHVYIHIYIYIYTGTYRF